MTDLQKSIYQTLAYFDIFEYPLTLLEIHKWLWKYKVDDLAEIKQAVQTDERIEHQNGFYYLKGNALHVATRLERYRLAEQKIKSVRKYITFLSLTPWVKGIFLCNTMAYQNSRKQSDIDLLVITKPGTVWTTRFLMTSFTKLLKIRPSVKKTEDTICLSFFLTLDNLNIEKLKIHPQRDIYLTYWVDQVLPIYQTKDVYNQFRRANNWIKKYLLNCYGYKLAFAPRIVKTKKRRLIKAWLENIPGESYFKKVQLKVMPPKLKQLANKDSRVVLNEKMLKFHDTDNREKYQKLWLKKVTS